MHHASRLAPDVDHLSASQARAALAPAPPAWSRTWSRSGVEALAQSALDLPPEVQWSYNTAQYGPWIGWPNRARRLTARRDDMVSHAARLYGWLRTVADGRHGAFRPVVRFLQRCHRGRGHNSPTTLLDIHDLVRRWPSPHRFVRWMTRTIQRADQILAPYGVRVSWRALAAAVSARRRVGKAARAAKVRAAIADRERLIRRVAAVGSV